MSEYRDTQHFVTTHRLSWGSTLAVLIGGIIFGAAMGWGLANDFGVYEADRWRARYSLLEEDLHGSNAQVRQDTVALTSCAKTEEEVTDSLRTCVGNLNALTEKREDLYVDSANHSGCASDVNDCKQFTCGPNSTPGRGPCKTFEGARQHLALGVFPQYHAMPLITATALDAQR